MGFSDHTNSLDLAKWSFFFSDFTGTEDYTSLGTDRRVRMYRDQCRLTNMKLCSALNGIEEAADAPASSMLLF